MTVAMNRRALLAAGAALSLSSDAAPALAQVAPDRATILATMKRATAFMTDEVAVGGGYVWNVLPDFSRRWGELEATPTMIWGQPPGTATVGHAFLDALQIFGLGYSWGGYESLAVHVSLADRMIAKGDYAGPVMRLQIGLENVEDLIEDVSRGLAAARAS